MAKTQVTLTKESILANIDGDRLKHAFEKCCAVVSRETPADMLAAHADEVHDLQEFADKLLDLGKAISETVKNAEGAYYDSTGGVTEGFKLRNTGYTVTVTDTAGLIAEAEKLGYNPDTLRERLAISATDAKKAMGLDDDRFKAEFADFIKVSKKADSLQRAW